MIILFIFLLNASVIIIGKFISFLFNFFSLDELELDINENDVNTLFLFE